jgi:hypothetical protein
MGQYRFAREMAGRIDSGEFDDSPVAVFRAAQAMEHLLTNWTWLDEAFPRTSHRLRIRMVEQLGGEHRADPGSST